jgi:hypothetical protein
MQPLFRIALIAFIALLTGCAGKDFTRPGADTFRLGQTRFAEVIQTMGEPRKTGDVLKNEKTIKSITYVYAATGGEPLEAGVIPARAQSYFFHDDILVGQEFVSSFKSDNSNFDEGKIAAIQKGKTTRAEVIQLLGRPSSAYIAPVVKETAGEAIGYTYQTTRGGAFTGFKFYLKLAKITFDDKDRVLEVEYSSSGNK